MIVKEILPWFALDEYLGNFIIEYWKQLQKEL